MIEPAHKFRGLSAHRMKRAVAKADPRRRDPLGLVPLPAQQALAQRERAFRPEPAGTSIQTLGRAYDLATFARGPQDGLRGGLTGSLVEHRIDQDAR